MRKVLRVLLVLVVLFGLLVLGGVLFLRHRVDQEADARRATMEKGFATWHAEVLKDHQWLAGLDFFRPVSGPDAGPFLNPRIPWSGPERVLAKWTASLPKDTPSLKLDPAATDGLRKGDWLEADPALYEKLDFGWMGLLAGYGFWDVEKASPWTVGEPFERIEAPLPTVMHLLSWAKLRLAKGMKEGQPAQSGAEVRALARLCFSTEMLLGEMVAVAMLGLEDEARARAAAKGLPVDRWTTLDEPSRKRIKRALWVIPAYVALDTPEAHGRDVEAIKVGRCAALNESTLFALALRPLLRDSRTADFERVGRNLELAKECRLSSLRAAWAAPDDPARDPLLGEKACLMGGAPSADCRLTRMVHWLPGARRFTGEVMLSVASPEWFGQYAHPK